MNENSIDLDANFLMELAQEGDVRTQTDFKMTKREDTCRETVDIFIDKLAKDKLAKKRRK